MNYIKLSKQELLKTCAELGIICLNSKNKSQLIKLINVKLNVEINESFNKINYFEKLDKIIYDILSRPEKNVLTYDILDTTKSNKNKLIVLKEKQRQMKIGEIWQEIIGNYDGFINLKNGHSTGLDIMSSTKKIVIELKNRTNTDNASSKKSNFDKLSKFKKSNPDYTCIYANINADSEKNTLQSQIKIIVHDNVEITHMIGFEFLKFIFGDDTNKTINFIKNVLDKYT